MEYKKADYTTLMKCPECGMTEREENDGMPERDDFRYETDENRVDYVECVCGCKFIEESD